MIIGYARLSGVSDLAAIDNTRQALIEAGAETVYLDTDAMFGQPASEATRGLEAAIRSIEAGDVLLTLTPALTAGSIDDLIGIAGRLTNRGASLRVLQIAGNQALDTSTAVGAMLLSALGLLAAFNTPASLQGRAAQPAYGQATAHMIPDSFAPRRSRGRPPTASTQVSEITRMREAGMRATDIADRLKICRASVYRVLNMASGAPNMATRAAAHEAATVS
eukprot:gene1458-1479_t